jgi:hypothetical protein
VQGSVEKMENDEGAMNFALDLATALGIASLMD